MEAIHHRIAKELSHRGRESFRVRFKPWWLTKLLRNDSSLRASWSTKLSRTSLQSTRHPRSRQMMSTFTASRKMNVMLQCPISSTLSSSAVQCQPSSTRIQNRISSPICPSKTMSPSTSPWALTIQRALSTSPWSPQSTSRIWRHPNLPRKTSQNRNLSTRRILLSSLSIPRMAWIRLANLGRPTFPMVTTTLSVVRRRKRRQLPNSQLIIVWLDTRCLSQAMSIRRMTSWTWIRWSAIWLELEITAI